MEEFDELLPTPDAEGSLELSHRAWLEVDEIVWTMGLEIIKLSLAYNRLKHIAPELGDLKLLREFDCSCNRLTNLPSRIGVLRHLKKLKCSGNNIETLPEELGKCNLIEELIVSENKLVALPRSIGNMRRLHTLLAQNNSLAMIPPTLADISKTLVTINLRANPRLEMIPKKIRGDTRLIMWVCKLHRENEVECQFVLKSIDQLESLSRGSQERHKHLKSQLKKYDEDRLELLRNLPTGLDRAIVVYDHLAKRASKVCTIS